MANGWIVPIGKMTNHLRQVEFFMGNPRYFSEGSWLRKSIRNDMDFPAMSDNTGG
jgi:hypothetical protein